VGGENQEEIYNELHPCLFKVFGEEVQVDLAWREMK
jgi:hypothetical protein